MKGKVITITRKRNTPSEITTDAKDSTELLNFLAQIGEMISKNTEASCFKMEVESISFPDEFFRNLKGILTEKKIDDVKIEYNSKMVI